MATPEEEPPVSEEAKLIIKAIDGLTTAVLKQNQILAKLAAKK